MVETHKASIATGGILLLLLATVIPAEAATNSDYNGAGTAIGQRDLCTGQDADLIYSTPPVGDDSSCDSQGTSPAAGSNSNTFAHTTYNSGVLTGCTNHNTAGADGSQCTGGFIFNADDATGAGNFGGDWPNATAVLISVNDPSPLNGFTGFNVRTTYMTVAGVTTTTALGAICVPDGGSFLVSSGAGVSLWNPPATTDTILTVTAFRAAVGGLSCALPGSAGVRDVTGTWTYSILSRAKAVTSIDPPVDNGDGTCSITWSFEAGEDDGAGGIRPTTYYGYASGQMDNDGGVFGVFEESGPMVGAYVQENQTTSGFDSILYGEWITAAAVSWEVSSEYAQDQSGNGPTDTTAYQCAPGVPSDLTSVLEPICFGKGIFNDGVVVASLAACVTLAGTPVVVCGVGLASYSCNPAGNCHDGVSVGVIASTLPDFAAPIDSTTTLSCGASTVASTSTAVAGFPVALGSGIKTAATSWRCDFTWTPAASGPSVHGGVCLDNFNLW